MRIKIGEIWYSSRSGQPIMVELTDQDKENIKSMRSEVTCYAVFQPNDLTYLTNEARLAWMQEGKLDAKNR